MLPSKYIANLAQKAYQTFKDTYTKKATEQFKELRPYIDSFINDLTPRKETILDVGCGPGLLLEYLRKRGFEDVLGIDISDHAIREAARRVPTYLLLRHDFHNLNFSPETFTTIFAINSLHYASKSSFRKILQKSLLITKPAGQIFLVVPQGEEERIREESYADPDSGETKQHAVFQSFYQPEELKKTLTEEDWQPNEITVHRGPHFPRPLLVTTVKKASS